jgi:hypothetical protein
MSTSPYKTADLVSVGSIVEYSDVANRRETYVVINIDRSDSYSPFVLRKIDADSGWPYTATDLAQSGWVMVSA